MAIVVGAVGADWPDVVVSEAGVDVPEGDATAVWDLVVLGGDEEESAPDPEDAAACGTVGAAREVEEEAQDDA